jgi:hypothetical protein
MGLFTVREEDLFFSKMGILFVVLLHIDSRPVPATCTVLILVCRKGLYFCSISIYMHVQHAVFIVLHKKAMS